MAVFPAAATASSSGTSRRRPSPAARWPWSKTATASPSTREKRKIDLEVAPGEIERRLARWKQPKPRYTRGVLAKYAELVSSASEGAVTDKYLRGNVSLG